LLTGSPAPLIYDSCNNRPAKQASNTAPGQQSGRTDAVPPVLIFSTRRLLTKYIIIEEMERMTRHHRAPLAPRLLVAAVGLLAAACAAVPPASVSLEARENRMSEIADTAIEKSLAPGILIMIRDREGLVYSSVRGLDDIDSARPLREDSLFRMYSMTKPVTSTVAMMLVEDGTLSLDDPVSKWIPGFAGARVYKSGKTLVDLETVPLDRPVLVRDLMQHTAGLGYPFSPDDPVSVLFALRGIETGSRSDAPPADGSARASSLEEMANRIAELPLRSQPGEAFTYGNATDVLGRVIEAATGERLSAVMSRRLFAPLGMSDTFFSVPDAKRDRLTSAYQAITEARKQDAILDVVDVAALPAGKLLRVDARETSPFATPYPIDFGGAGLVSTGEDYLKFAQMIANGGTLKGVRILSEETAAQMLTGSLPEKARATPSLAGRGLDFGLGFAVIAQPGIAGLNIPQGTSFWGGAASTIFWVDPVNDTSGVILTQVFGGDFRAAYLAMIDAWYAPPESGK
jgi:CubicO group peptidase (beta-lactamase class C family)